jgi:hypothetical protein
MISNFNLDYWPFVFFKSSGDLKDDSFEEYKKNYLNLLIKCKNNNEKMILIYNLNNITSYPIEYIAKQAEFNKQIFKFNKEYIKCVCILSKDTNFKNILNLFFTFIKPSSPYKLCRTFDKINKYLLEKFNISFKTNIFDDTIKNNLVFDEDEDNEDNEEIEYNIENDEYFNDICENIHEDICEDICEKNFEQINLNI